MNFFEKTLKTPSIPTTDNDVKKIWDDIKEKHIDASERIEKIMELIENGMSQEDAFNQVIKK